VSKGVEEDVFGFLHEGVDVFGWIWLLGMFFEEVCHERGGLFLGIVILRFRILIGVAGSSSQESVGNFDGVGVFPRRNTVAVMKAIIIT